MTNKTFLVRDWTKMEVHSVPCSAHGMQKIDTDGKIWEWTNGGKRIVAKLIKKG